MNERNRSTRWIVAGLAAGHFVLHLLTNGNYGIFRDELYYIDCARHLAWGYVDQPPLSIAVLSGWMELFGDSVASIRIIPAFIGSVLILLAAAFARELEGGRFAQTLAALAVFISPHFAVITGFYSMNPFDVLVWAVALLLMMRLLRTGNERIWLTLGVVLGLGLLNKISVLVLGFSMVVGLLATGHHRRLASPWAWGGGAIALLLFAPHVAWQIANDWPALEFIENAKLYKIADQTPLSFFSGQLLINHPANAVLWIAGIVYTLAVRKHRWLGATYLLAFLVFNLQQSKVYYLSAIVTPLLGVGAVAFVKLIQRPRLRWLGPLQLASMIFTGLAILPLAIPLLAPANLARYQRSLGLPPSNAENNEIGALDQHFADRFGWPQMAQAVADAYRGLTPEQQGQCVIVGSNYGEAGAINYFGGELGLPRAISGHNNYAFWGCGDRSGEVAVVVGYDREEIEESYDTVRAVGTLDAPFAMPYESDLTIYVAEGLRRPLAEVFASLRFFI